MWKAMISVREGCLSHSLKSVANFLNLFNPSLKKSINRDKDIVEGGFGDAAPDGEAHGGQDDDSTILPLLEPLSREDVNDARAAFRRIQTLRFH